MTLKCAKNDLLPRLTAQLAAVIPEIETRDDEAADKAFWGIWNAANGAAAKLGLPVNRLTGREPITFNLGACEKC